jgi:hypothetical protein
MRNVAKFFPTIHISNKKRSPEKWMGLFIAMETSFHSSVFMLWTSNDDSNGAFWSVCGFRVLKAVCGKIAIFWCVALCILLIQLNIFGGLRCLHLKCRRGRWWLRNVANSLPDCIRAGHVDATSSDRQLNAEGQMSRYNNAGVPWSEMRAYWTVGPVTKEHNFRERELTIDRVWTG